jgi:hypothetical protein
VYDWRLNLTDNCLWKQIMRRTSSLGGILTSCPCSFELLSTFGFAILLLAIMIQINIESCNNWIQYFKLEESHWACQFVESDILTQWSGIYALQQNESNEEFRTWIRSFVGSQLTGLRLFSNCVWNLVRELDLNLNINCIKR